jgi:hypothetical protein
MRFHRLIPCYPLDGIVAFNRAMDEVYGFTKASRVSFWGEEPPVAVAVKTGPGREDVVHAVHGTLSPVTWEGGNLTVDVNMTAPLAIQISGAFKRKFEREVLELVSEAERRLVEHSIYRGKPVEIDLSFLKSGEFDPELNAPVFMDVDGDIPLILPHDIEVRLQGTLWNVMRHPDAYKSNHIAFKRAILLAGTYGTGKTQTAKYTAKVASESGLGFFYLKNPTYFTNAFELAAMYGPSVLFVEDIDAIFGGDRSDQMNAFLNVLDGIATKKANVACVFTTNYPEKVNAAFLRPGRIDKVINYTAPDAEAAGRFVLMIGGKMLAEDAHDGIKEIGDVYAGLVPAVISGAVREAKEYAIGEFGDNIRGKVGLQALLTAGRLAKADYRGQQPVESPEVVLAKRLRGVLEDLHLTNGR